MLEQTFIHIPGIGRRTERWLWQSGVRSWGDFRGAFSGTASIQSALRRRLETHIPQSIEALQKRDATFFARLSSLGEAWRLFPEFAEQCVFLDIETTGLSLVFDTVTIVGLFDGYRYQVFIDGRNLQDLPDHLKRYSVVVTFNGAGFDLRFLRLAFKDLHLPPIHIDLRWAARRLGYRGGLKAIEREFGLRRDSSVKDLDGHDATVLWSRHLRGDRGALQQLIAYNSVSGGIKGSHFRRGEGKPAVVQAAIEHTTAIAACASSSHRQNVFRPADQRTGRPPAPSAGA